MTLALIDHIAHEIATLAQRAVLYEVTTTPKPGLVDKNNCGSHTDMNFFTFMSSSTALYRGFYQCALAGLNFDQSEATLLLDRIRAPGMSAETDMFRATRGINTHKGIIFSLGILAAATGYYYRCHGSLNIQAETLSTLVSKMTCHLIEKDFANLSTKRDLTYGEALYVTKGITGIRGEAASGFNTVIQHAMPVLRKISVQSNESEKNEHFLEALLRLMAVNTDTNLLARGGAVGLEDVKSLSQSFVAAGGMTQPHALKKLERMNETLIKRNLSPGGSADLLATGIYMSFLEGILN